jgi:transposase-like protein
MNVCKVCRSPYRAAIDSALVAGTALRRVAKQYGATASSLRRHREHLSHLLAKAKDASEIARATTLLEQVREVSDAARRITAKAESSGRLRTALGGLREITRSLELLARLSGEIESSARITVGVAVNARDSEPEMSPEERDAEIKRIEAELRYFGVLEGEGIEIGSNPI